MPNNTRTLEIDILSQLNSDTEIISRGLPFQSSLLKQVYHYINNRNILTYILKSNRSKIAIDSMIFLTRFHL